MQLISLLLSRLIAIRKIRNQCSWGKTIQSHFILNICFSLDIWFGLIHDHSFSYVTASVRDLKHNTAKINMNQVTVVSCRERKTEVHRIEGISISLWLPPSILFPFLQHLCTCAMLCRISNHSYFFFPQLMCHSVNLAEQIQGQLLAQVAIHHNC